MVRNLAQQAVIKFVRPYVRAELPGWGTVYSVVVGSYRRERFWANAGKVKSKNKLFGFETNVDLSLWADRQTFFLGRWYDLPTQLLAAALKSEVIVDVGANRGDFSLAVARMLPNSRIIAFEPNPEISSTLKKDLAFNSISNVDVRECALGDTETSLPLHVPFANSGSASFGGLVSEGASTQSLPIRIGDDELSAITPGFIKIDVEGYELRALKGLRKTIERCSPVIETELTEDNLARCGTSRSEVQQFMTGLGYRGYGMDLERSRSGLSLKLVTLGNTWDAVWLPKGLDPNTITATTHDLHPHLC